MKLLKFALLLPVCLPLAAAGGTETARTPQAVSKEYLSLPMQFEPNVGQTDPEVKYVARGPGYTVYLTPGEAVLSLRSASGVSLRQARRGLVERQTSRAQIRMSLMGANPRPEAASLDSLPGTVNYFIGNDPAQWHTAIPTFARVAFREVYPGVDLVYYGNQRQLEYDFVLGPGANPKAIAVAISGAEKLEVDAKGGLVAKVGRATLRWNKPFAYQTTASGRHEVGVRFVLGKSGRVGFDVASYDSKQPLVIDPSLVYSTYLGSSGLDFIAGIGVDTSGSVYVEGDTDSLNFPTHNAYQPTSNGSNEVFVVKLNAAGTATVYSTYIGGNGNDSSGGIAVDAAGNAYITGETSSLNFPHPNGAFSANGGYNDAFIAKLSASGSSLLYGSYMGGGGDDAGSAIAADNSGHAYIAGFTYSIGTGNSPLPTKPNGAFQTRSGGGRDAFVASFDTTLSGSSSQIYTTFLGGSTDERANGIAIDSSGAAYIVGEISASPTYPAPPTSDFPVVNAFQSSFNQGATNSDAGTFDGFLSKLSPDGTSLQFSTFLGGNDDDFAYDVTLDSAGRIYVVGESASTNFPTTLNAVQPTNAGVINSADFPGPDMFIIVFQTTGTSLYYSTYLGGSADETAFETYPFSVAVDKQGYIYVTGNTTSDDFPITVGADQTNGYLSSAIAFITKINPLVPGPAGIIYSTYFGGDTSLYGPGAANYGTAIAVDTSGNFYAAGVTSATNFTVTPGAFRPTNSGGFYDGYITKFTSPRDLSVAMFPSMDPVVVGSNLTYTIQVNNNGPLQFTGVTNFVQLNPSQVIQSVSSTVGNWSTNGNLLAFQLGVVTNNQSITQTIVVSNPTPAVVTNAAMLTSFEMGLEPNSGNNTSIVVTTIRGIADVRLTSAIGPSTSYVGSNITYTFNIINKGPTYPATAVVLTDVLPSQVGFVSASSTLGTCSNIFGVVTCSIPVLAVGSNASFSITVSALTNGVISNMGTVSAFELDPIPSNNSGSVMTTINTLADLAVGQTGPGSVAAGNNVTYSINVTNFGPSQASTVVVTDTLPPGVNYVSASSSQGTFFLSGGAVTYSLGFMPTNGVASLSVTVQPVNGGIITNAVVVSNTDADLNPVNNSAVVTTTVIAAADLAIGQSPSQITTLVSSNVSFSFNVTNRGPSTAPNVIITEPVQGVSLRSAQGANCSQSGGIITCTLGSMVSGATAAINLTGVAVLDGTFTNIATISSDVTDPNPANSASMRLIVNPNPNAPLLKITRAGTSVVLSWSTNALHYLLQSGPSFLTNSAWVTLTNIPVQIGNMYYVTNSVSSSNTFYRLAYSQTSLSGLLINGKMVVSWPAAPPAGNLKFASSLANPIVWSSVTTAPALIGSRYYVTNPTTANRSFYRLFN